MTVERETDAVAEAILAEIERATGHDELFAAYARLRERAPLFWSASHNAWVASSFAVVHEAFHHPEAVLDQHAADAFRAGADGPWYDMWRRMMLFLDPADHARIRRLVVRMFTRRAVEQLRPVSRQVVDRLLSQLGDRREMNLIGEFAYELPIAVIAGLCGLPASDVPALVGLSRDFAARTNPSAQNADTVRRGDATARALTEYFHDQLARRTGEDDDMLSPLAAALRDAEFDEADLIANAALLFMAGHETTANLIANAIAALLAHPDQLALLRREPERIDKAVEEFLRFNPPLHGDFRSFPGGAVIGGQTLAPGERVMLLLAAANHDPAHWADPDRLDITRDARDHVSFGWGAYYCLGASLARVQAQVAIGAVVERCADLQWVSPPAWNPTLFGRGPAALSVRW
jgi:cytochrome P450